jgi:hypothetical protein
MRGRGTSRSLGLALVLLSPLVLAPAAGASEPRWTDPPTIAIVGPRAVAANGGWLSESDTPQKYVFRFTRDGVLVKGPASVPKTTPADTIPANTYPDAPNANLYTLRPADQGRRLCVEVWAGVHSRYVTADGVVAYDVWEWGHVNSHGEPAIACTGSGAPPSPPPTPPPAPPPPPPVVPAPGPPSVLSPPAVAGTAMVEETLTASTGTWAGAAPVATSVRWERCDAAGANCSDAGVDGATYTLIPFDIGKRLRAVVTVTNLAGSQTARSDLTAVVSELRPTPTRTSIPAAKVTAPHRLAIDGVVLSPKRLGRRGPVTATLRVLDDRGFRIEGALVSAVVLPAGSLVPPAETGTGEDATAALVFTRGTTKLRGRAAVTLVLTARRPGDRLVSPRSSTVRVKLPVARAAKPVTEG